MAKVRPFPAGLTRKEFLAIRRRASDNEATLDEFISTEQLPLEEAVVERERLDTELAKLKED